MLGNKNNSFLWKWKLFYFIIFCYLILFWVNPSFMKCCHIFILVLEGFLYFHFVNYFLVEVALQLFFSLENLQHVLHLLGKLLRTFYTSYIYYSQYKKDCSLLL